MNFIRLHAEIAQKQIRFLLVSINGVPGCGKTTRLELIRLALSQNPNWKLVIVPEPVKEWEESGILEAYYSDINRWGLIFQQEALRSRATGLISTIERVTDEMPNDNVPKTVVLMSERSPDSDRIFMDMLRDMKLVTDLEYRIYDNWYNLWHRMIPEVKLCHIFIDTTVETSLERVKMRSRKGETIPMDYQTSLRDKHCEFYEKMPARQTLRIDGETDIVYDQESIKNQCEEIVSFVERQLQ